MRRWYHGGMNRNRPLTAILAVASTALLVGIYFVAYFASADRSGDNRYFESRWQEVLFTPAMKIESVCVGRHIFTPGPAENPFE